MSRNSPGARGQGFHSFKTPVRIDSFQPHGHFRLAAKTLEIFYPDTSHIYEDDVAPLVPKGAVLVITGYYDNTTANKQNPDPDIHSKEAVKAIIPDRS